MVKYKKKGNLKIIQILEREKKTKKYREMMKKSKIKTQVTAIATFTGPGIFGFVLFEQLGARDPVRVTFRLEGFRKAQTLHAIHIHEYGDLRSGCSSTGGHWNPFHKNHGNQMTKDRHAGDLINNLKTNDAKSFLYQYDDSSISILGKHSILGRSIVIHEGIDDLGLGENKESLINGNAGGRMACAVIGVANPDL